MNEMHLSWVILASNFLAPLTYSSSLTTPSLFFSPSFHLNFYSFSVMFIFFLSWFGGYIYIYASV
ncbi:hypothetical protein F4809DRAFT_613102 [Biscogniauxia mediterranea]|nr:hypothetical protein F4809DRAFT_613102 [Biscogniauxia mediterranea]